jgi:esterase/lipase superfamily enzyme
MPTTVYFATNRLVTNAIDPVNGYPAVMVPPLNPDQMTYGIAFVDGGNIASNNAGTITQINDIQQGGFSQSALDDLSASGRNLLVFVHGFNNTFSDAITRAAFNREWLAASGQPDTDMTVVAFCWPSLGQFASLPVPQKDYLTDQSNADKSGIHLMSFLANLGPILDNARANGFRSTLLAHSMGNMALESGVHNWFLHGNGDARMFDLTTLAAGDCRYDTFDQPFPSGLSGLTRLSERVLILYSQADQVLLLSMAVNLGAKRLGQDGPHNRADPVAFPPATYLMEDCTDFRDYPFNPLSSHQYYRLSPSVRTIIARSIGGPLVA